MAHPVLAGAEAWSHRGGPSGALILHGFTGDPSSVRGLAGDLAAAGLSVELPRLPGHGTHVDDLLDTSWDDWAAHADGAYRELAARCRTVAVVGLSMGAVLAARLAADHPGIAGLVSVNGLFDPAQAQLVPLIDELLAGGVELVDSVGSDVAAPGVAESSYPATPMRPARSLLLAVAALHADLARIRCPTLVVTSRQDHVVAPVSSDVLAAGVSGPVERLWLERSFHVATIDLDGELVAARTVEFVRRVTGAPRGASGGASAGRSDGQGAGRSEGPAGRSDAELDGPPDGGPGPDPLSGRPGAPAYGREGGPSR